MKNSFDHQTNQWLKTSGINPRYLISSGLLLLRAEKTAHWLLQHSLIDSMGDQILLKKFVETAKNPKSRPLITDAMAYKVLNLGTKERRRQFRIRRTGK
jgi:hypothetical protein